MKCPMSKPQEIMNSQQDTISTLQDTISTLQDTMSTPLQTLGAQQETRDTLHYHGFKSHISRYVLDEPQLRRKDESLWLQKHT